MLYPKLCVCLRNLSIQLSSLLFLLSTWKKLSVSKVCISSSYGVFYCRAQYGGKECEGEMRLYKLCNTQVSHTRPIRMRYRQSRPYNDLIEYKIAQNKAVKEYRKAKRQFEKKLAKDIKSNPKCLYAYVRSKTKVNEVVGPLKDNNGQLVSESGVICEIMNAYFGSVFTSVDLLNELPETKCKFGADN